MKAVVFKSKFQGVFGRFHFRECTFTTTNQDEIEEIKNTGFFKRGMIWVASDVEIKEAADLSFQELKSKLRDMGVKFPKTSTADDLKKLLADEEAKNQPKLGAKGTS